MTELEDKKHRACDLYRTHQQRSDRSRIAGREQSEAHKKHAEPRGSFAPCYSGGLGAEGMPASIVSGN